MDNMQYYFIFFDTFNKNYDIEFETTGNLVTGDIIDIRHFDNRESLFEEYKTEHFIIKQRVFISDNNFENVGGIFNLLVEPITL